MTMAKTKKQTKTVTRYSPKGTKVMVSEKQAEKLKGYSTTKPKS